MVFVAVVPFTSSLFLSPTLCTLFYLCLPIASTSLFNSQNADYIRWRNLYFNSLESVQWTVIFLRVLWIWARFDNITNRKDQVPSVHDRSVWHIWKCQKIKCFKWSCLVFFDRFQGNSVYRSYRWSTLRDTPSLHDRCPNLFLFFLNHMAN